MAFYFLQSFTVSLDAICVKIDKLTFWIYLSFTYINAFKKKRIELKLILLPSTLMSRTDIICGIKVIQAQ